MSELVEKLRTASSNVAYARQEGSAGYLAGWEHLTMRMAATRIEELEAALQACADAPYSGWTIAQALARAALNPSARSE